VPSPSDPGDELDVVLHYLSYHEGDYARARHVVKKRARQVVLCSASATGGIAVAGTATAVWDASWLGLVSTGLAGLIGVLAAWDGLYRHRDLWVLRSIVLGRLQLIKRTAEFRLAAGCPRDAIAADAMAELNKVLQHDLETWAELKRSRPAAEGGNAQTN
jgi:hypothetical protein